MQTLDAGDMASIILQRFSYDLKKCRSYIIVQYLEADEDEILNEYWLEVGCDVEKKIEVRKAFCH